MDTAALKDISSFLRYHILRITHAAKSGHPTTCFSATDLATVLFFRYLRFDINNPDSPVNDRFIMSKGHASALLYSLYLAAGVITEKDLDGYRTFESNLEGHPTFRFPFTEAATGSLGQGLSIAAGEALALRKQFAVALPERQLSEHHYEETTEAVFDANPPVVPFSVPRVFVMVGDGELSEGSVWEAASWASQQKLTNLIAIVDCNRFGQFTQVPAGHDLEVYRRRFEAFGWGAIVIDGHDYAQIDTAYEKAIVYKGGPVAILAKTLKGKGVELWEDKPGWHNKMLPPEELEKVLTQYKPKADVKAVIQKPDIIVHRSSFMVHGKNNKQNDQRSAIFYEPGKPVATKQAFGNALLKLMEQIPALMVLDADVANSLSVDEIGKKFPDRFLQMYIAEQNSVGVAVGLARRGMIPVFGTFAAFLTRAHDQIRMAPLSNVNLYMNGSYAGVSIGKDGPSQMGLEDIALMRSIPESIVLYPSDPYQTEYLTAEMLKLRGVVYMRTTREPTPVIYESSHHFPIGGSKIFKIKSSSVKNDDTATVVAAGITVHEALKAQQELAHVGIGIRVIDCYSIKPIDKETLKLAVKETKHLIVFEDHYPEGGLGEAVMSALSGVSHGPIHHLAVRKLPKSGKPEELLHWEEINEEAIRRLIHDTI